MLNVVCAILFHKNKFLLARRKPGKSMAGKWEFPGGKVEPNESEEQALKRELLEEFGTNVSIGERLGENIHQYDSFQIRLVAYRCSTDCTDFELTDHDQIQWVTKEQAVKFDLAEADIPLLDLI